MSKIVKNSPRWSWATNQMGNPRIMESIAGGTPMRKISNGHEHTKQFESFMNGTKKLIQHFLLWMGFCVLPVAAQAQFGYGLDGKGGIIITGYNESEGGDTMVIPSSIYDIYDSTYHTVVNIDEGAFQSLNIISVTIPNTVTIIQDGAFIACHKLTSVTIPNGVTTLGWEVFQNCSGLTSAIIPNSLHYVNYYDFLDVTSLFRAT